MKGRIKPTEMVSATLPLSSRVQKGLALIEEGRYRKKQVWGEDLTVLDKETAKLPLVKRKALAIKKVLSEMPVDIKEYELLVGSAVQGTVESSMPFPEYATQEEKESAAKNLTGPKSVFGHFSPYYPRYLKWGISGLQKIAEEKLDEVRRKGIEPEKESWYESVIISLDGLKNLVRRHRDLASKLADSETNLTRKEELREIAKISQNLLEGPPQTFREALQAFWFAHLSFHSTLNFLPEGRFDQSFWPYLKRDLEKGAIIFNQAQELIDCLWLKFNERLQTFEIMKGTSSPYEGRASADEIGAKGVFLGGKTTVDRIVLDGDTYLDFLQTMTLSGLTPEGLDGTNPLTYICLNATLRLGVPQPELYVRFHDGSPPELYQRVADCKRAGLANPNIYNDEVIIPAFLKLGIPIEDARDYTSDGCFEAHIQGKTNFKHIQVSAAEALDRVLYPAKWEELEAPGLYVEAMDPFKDSKAPDPYTFHSFNEVMESFKEQLDKFVKGYVESADILRDGRLYNIAPLPLLSAFVEGPLEKGQDITQNGIKYGFQAPQLAGLSHAADSLAVIKKLCFEEKAIEWPELLDAIRDNWNGREHLRQLVRTRAPAYGNDVNYVDDIAREIVEHFVESVKKYSAKVKSNLKFPCGIGTFSQYGVLGRHIGATPDGRLAGEPLGTNASPSLGRTAGGVTAAVNSFLKLPHIDLASTGALDISLENRAELLLQLENFIKSFIQGRGSTLTIAVNDCEKLRAAQKEPEKYRSLTVRVGGWQAYFVDLPRHHQDLQIRRCEQYMK